MIDEWFWEDIEHQLKIRKRVVVVYFFPLMLLHSFANSPP
jgi:hypothetical protein